jgi:hypothetical protein
MVAKSTYVHLRQVIVPMLHINPTDSLVNGTGNPAKPVGERVEDLRHGPNPTAPDVWSASSFIRSAAEEPWIRTVPDEGTRVGIKVC